MSGLNFGLLGSGYGWLQDEVIGGSVSGNLELREDGSVELRETGSWGLSWGVSWGNSWGNSSGGRELRE